MSESNGYGVRPANPHEVGSLVPVANEDKRFKRAISRKPSKDRGGTRKKPDPDEPAAGTADGPHSVDTLA
jgi:hypothetical protein